MEYDIVKDTWKELKDKKTMKEINIYTESDNTKKSDPLKHDYNIVTDDTSLTELHRSGDSSWTRPGELVIRCVEDVMKGEYKIKINDRKLITLDYAEAHELFITLGFVQDMGKIEYRESKIIKSYD